MRCHPGYPLALALIAAPAALRACSCVSYEPVKACQIYYDSAVIVRTREIDTNDRHTGGISEFNLYRFAVVEAFKGLPPSSIRQLLQLHHEL